MREGTFARHPVCCISHSRHLNLRKIDNILSDIRHLMAKVEQVCGEAKTMPTFMMKRAARDPAGRSSKPSRVPGVTVQREKVR